MSVKLRLTCIIVTLTCLMACQDNDGYPNKRTDKERQTYQALNDSMQHLSTKALTLIRQQMEEADDSLTWYDYYLMYGRHYLLTANHDSVVPYAERTLRFANRQQQTPRTRGLAALANSTLASYHYLLHHESDTVIRLYHQAYQLMMESDIKESLPDMSANLGDAYVAQGNLAEGSRWYRRALYLNDSLALPQKQTLTLYMGLGRIYTTVGDFEQARSYYERTDRQFDEMKPNMQSYFLNNYGNYFYFRQQYPQALQTFRRLKAHLERHKAQDNFDMFLCKINMADVFLNLGQTDSASLYVDEAEQYFKEQQVNVGVYYAQTIRIGIALKEKRLKDVERILQEAQGTDVADHDMKAIRHRYLNQYYAAIGDYKKAYAGLRSHIMYTDSTAYRLKNMRSEDILTRLTEDTIRLHHQLALKEKEDYHQKERQWGITTLAMTIIIILLFILWGSQEHKRRLQTSLDIMMLRLQNARQRISPHFVFNVLNSEITKSNEDVSHHLSMLAQLIRTNLDLTHNNYITLAEELDFVSQYIDIERETLNGDFDFSIEAPERAVLESIMTPSMLVQILTENALLHGLKNKEGEKKLTIRVETDDQETRISVIDNGPGFDIRQYSSHRSRTGLNIIRTTVSAVNEENKKHKMRFDIHNDNGCHAILTIPKNIKLP